MLLRGEKKLDGWKRRTMKSCLQHTDVKIGVGDGKKMKRGFNTQVVCRFWRIQQESEITKVTAFQRHLTNPNGCSKSSFETEVKIFVAPIKGKSVPLPCAGNPWAQRLQVHLWEAVSSAGHWGGHLSHHREGVFFLTACFVVGDALVWWNLYLLLHVNNISIKMQRKSGGFY